MKNTMKVFETIRSIAIIALIAVIGVSFAFISCDSGPEATFAKYRSMDLAGNVYDLEIERNESKAAFKAQIGDSYNLTFTTLRGDVKKSSGTVSSVSGDTFTLSRGDSLTVIVSNGGMTKMSGKIIFTDGSTRQAPGQFNPVGIGTVTVNDLIQGRWDLYSYNYEGKEYDCTVIIAQNAWFLIVWQDNKSVTTDSGYFSKWEGNTATIYSFYLNANVGTATTSDGKRGTVTLNKPSLIQGKFNYTKSHDPINAIAYGDNKFVAVGRYGTMSYSTDGITWKAVTNSTFDVTSSLENSIWSKYDSINAIAYGNGKFVAVGDYGKMAYSTDGVSWTAVTDSTFGEQNNIYAITYGNGKFVASGDAMAHSTDGTTWTAVAGSFNTTPSANIRAITYGNDKFVGVNYYGKIAYSTEGTTWTAGTDSIFPATELYNTAIAYGNGKFVATHNDNMAYSTDGSTWTAGTTSIFGKTYLRGGIAYGNNKFVAVGGNGKMAYSSDGAIWTAVANSTFDVPDKYGYFLFSTIAYANGKFVAACNGDIAYSTDGVTWTEVLDSKF